MEEVGGSGLDPGQDFLAVTEVLDALNKEMQDLEQHFKEKTVQMPRYDVERNQKAVSEVCTLFNLLFFLLYLPSIMTFTCLDLDSKAILEVHSPLLRRENHQCAS